MYEAKMKNLRSVEAVKFHGATLFNRECEL